MQSITSKAIDRKKRGRLVYGYRIMVRYPSVKPFPDFHNRVVFSENVPGSWLALVENQDIQRADLYKRGKIVAQFNRALPELYQAKGRGNRCP